MLPEQCHIDRFGAGSATPLMIIHGATVSSKTAIGIQITWKLVSAGNYGILSF